MFIHHAYISKAVGAPVDWIAHEPATATINNIGLGKYASHPHAAMLLIDFILSNEGQAQLREAEYFPANPAVDPLETLRPVVPEKLGMKQVFLDTASFFEDRAKSIELQNKYFDKQ